MTHNEFRERLKSLGLRQKDISERLGINISTINRWALGELPVPRYAEAYLAAIAELAALQGLREAIAALPR